MTNRIVPLFMLLVLLIGNTGAWRVYVHKMSRIETCTQIVRQYGPEDPQTNYQCKDIRGDYMFVRVRN